MQVAILCRIVNTSFSVANTFFVYPLDIKEECLIFIVNILKKVVKCSSSLSFFFHCKSMILTNKYLAEAGVKHQSY